VTYLGLSFLSNFLLLRCAPNLLLFHQLLLSGQRYLLLTIQLPPCDLYYLTLGYQNSYELAYPFDLYFDSLDQ